MDNNLDELMDDYFEKLQVPDHQIIFEDTYRKIANDFYEMGRKSKPVEEPFKPLEGLDAIKAKYYDDGFKNGFDEGVDSVKPVECITDAEMEKGLDELTKFKRFASALSDIYNIIPSHSSLRPKDIDWNNFCAGLLTYLKKNQPVELSEDDFDAMFDEYCDQHPDGLTLEECGRFFYEKGKKACQEWSEEDERMLSRCIKSIETSKQFADSGTFKEAKDKEIDWLKSLRPGWKPSEEQMNALNFAITYFMHETNYKNPTELRELYDDLLKLK